MQFGEDVAGFSRTGLLEYLVLDPDTHPGYLPFGHANERCWGRHMVMPLAERLLNIARSTGVTVRTRRTA